MHEESEHLLGAAAAYVSPQPDSEEHSNEASASVATSPFLQLQELREVVQSPELESELREMAAEDINSAILKVAMRFIRDGVKLTPQSAPSNSYGALIKWHKENGDMGKALLQKNVKAYTYPTEKEAQQKTAELVFGLTKLENDEYTAIDKSKKNSIAMTFRKNDCFGVKAIAKVLYPNSSEAQALLISNVNSIEKHFYSQSHPSSSASSTLADVGVSEAPDKQPSSDDALASPNLSVEHEMQTLGSSATSLHVQEDSAHT